MIEEVIEDIEPSDEERNKLRQTTLKLEDLIKQKADELGIDAEPRLVGSSARGTWLSGDRDIDFFILLPMNLDTEEFRRKGLRLAKEVGKESERYWEDYAEHPYVKALFNEFEVDLVPAYNIDEASEVRSAVDRTPLHDDYVSSRLDTGLKRNIRVLKKFMKSNNVYGAELKIRGFSGYLTELITLYYGEKNDDDLNSFNNVLKAASEWKGDEVIDLENHGCSSEFSGPLIVVDPVDPDRDVAAALITEKWSYFVAASQSYLNQKRIEFFGEKSNKHNLNEVINGFKERKTEIVALEFDKPDLVDDTLFPQLYKTENWIKNILEQEGFNVIRSGVFRDNEKALVFFEVASKLPRVEKHVGPPVTAKEHSEDFIEKYLHEDVFSGPFIEKDRWVVERIKKKNSPHEVINEKISDYKQSGVGKNLKRVNKEVLVGASVLKDRYIDFFGKYLDKKAPWMP